MFRNIVRTILLVCTLWFGYGIAYAQNPKTYIHPKALQLLPLIQSEAYTYAPHVKPTHYFAGLIEHESCISLKHKRCWSSDSQLKTSREQGLGLSQLTRAWTPAGKLRMDVVADLRRQYPKELSGMQWETLTQHPELQIRAMVLLTRQNYKALNTVRDPLERLKMADSAYNGGVSNVIRSRSVCNLARGCDPQIWFDHTERYNQKSTKILYDVRSARTINNHHVRDVFEVRMPKFQPLFEKPLP